MEVHDPTSEARWLIEAVSGMDFTEQVLEADAPVSQRAVTQLDELLARRATGEPIQYVLGAWNFCGLDLFVDRRVLIPRPETESVVGHAIAEVQRLGERVGRADPWAGGITHYAVADLGTGSGAIALALADALPDAEVWATDADDDALQVARANIAATGSVAMRIRVESGRWFAALPDELRGSLLVVVSNPPYIAHGEELPAAVHDWEPHDALFAGPTGLEAIEVLLTEATDWLDAAGTLVLELAPHQAGTASELARTLGYQEVLVRQDLAGRDRSLIARKRA